MSQIIDGLSAVAQNYDAIFCDVWGVVHNGKRAHVNAVEALMKARLDGKPVILVTNSPKTPSAVIGQLDRLEVPKTAYDQVITAGLAMQYSFFAQNYKRFYFMGSEFDQVIYSDIPEGVTNHMEPTDDYKKADAILCAGPDYGHKDSPEDYALELRQLVSRKLPMFCANPDIVVDHGEARIWCGGALAQAYEKMGGVVYQFGKPYPPIYQLARERLQNMTGHEIAPSRILFIGDGVDTDLKGAMLEDMDALFVAGGLAAEETGAVGGAPDPEKLSAYLQKHQIDPLYTMGSVEW